MALSLLVAIDLIVVLVVALLIGAFAGTDTEPPAHRRLPSFVEPEKRGLAPTFQRAATVNRLPEALLEALAWRESRWRSEAYNPESGATGIGQLLPQTAEFVARELLHDPTLDPQIAVDNIRLTARYLRALIDRFGGRERLGVAAYLQGSTSVVKDGISHQTAAYIHDIAILRTRFEAAAAGHPGPTGDPLGQQGRTAR